VYAFGHCGHCSLPSSRISAFLARFAAELLRTVGGGMLFLVVVVLVLPLQLFAAFLLRDRSFPRRSCTIGVTTASGDGGDSGGDSTTTGGGIGGGGISLS